ncbi:hypothetical protein Q9Q94_08130 [Uliginosibacterium sp. 31-16]|uniref:hypothetical protein n=1 Tax=Uliginosibacterium sp. 31-16 TaxID=3068315 RepID=UPI00273E80F6|nr:hypothetical protein [Uliginosibacterium sp. 31-16]MDP5239493.1 hypothetical protein [Uliginosibacterium sp. 31-16]
MMKTISMFLAVLLLSACATVYEQRYDFHDGWRKARVQEIGPFNKLAKNYGYTCRQSPEKIEGKQGAIVGYSNGGRWRSQLMLQPEERTVKKGDLVYANILKCEEPMAPRAPD